MPEGRRNSVRVCMRPGSPVCVHMCWECLLVRYLIQCTANMCLCISRKPLSEHRAPSQGKIDLPSFLGGSKAEGVGATVVKGFKQALVLL